MRRGISLGNTLALTGLHRQRRRALRGIETRCDQLSVLSLDERCAPMALQ